MSTKAPDELDELSIFSRAEEMLGEEDDEEQAFLVAPIVHETARAASTDARLLDDDDSADDVFDIDALGAVPAAMAPGLPAVATEPEVKTDGTQDEAARQEPGLNPPPGAPVSNVEVKTDEKRWEKVTLGMNKDASAEQADSPRPKGKGKGKERGFYDSKR